MHFVSVCIYMCACVPLYACCSVRVYLVFTLHSVFDLYSVPSNARAADFPIWRGKFSVISGYLLPTTGGNITAMSTHMVNSRLSEQEVGVLVLGRRLLRVVIHVLDCNP